MCSKTSSHGTPSSCSITCTTSASVSGGTSSCRRASSATTSGGIRSGRVERIWPSLAKVGPSSSSVSRSRAARFAPFSRAVAQAVLGDDGGDPGGAGGQVPPPASSVTLRLHGGVFFGSLGRVHDHDRTARVVRDAVRDVAEQELAAAAHPEVADDEHVGVLRLGGGDDRVRGSSPAIDPGLRARAAHLLGVDGELGLRSRGGGPGRTPGRRSAGRRSAAPSPPPTRRRASPSRSGRWRRGSVRPPSVEAPAMPRGRPRRTWGRAGSRRAVSRSGPRRGSRASAAGTTRRPRGRPRRHRRARGAPGRRRA